MYYNIIMGARRVGVVYEQPPCDWIVIVDVKDKMNYYLQYIKYVTQ